LSLDIQLVEVQLNGRPAQEAPLNDTARSVCEATVSVYERTGFLPPWVGYLAIRQDEAVGTCAFKSPPIAGCVEIAYFTFPATKGRASQPRWPDC
jgi:hypothetical protein